MWVTLSLYERDIIKLHVNTYVVLNNTYSNHICTYTVRDYTNSENSA